MHETQRGARSTIVKKITLITSSPRAAIRDTDLLSSEQSAPQVVLRRGFEFIRVKTHVNSVHNSDHRGTEQTNLLAGLPDGALRGKENISFDADWSEKASGVGRAVANSGKMRNKEEWLHCAVAGAIRGRKFRENKVTQALQAITGSRQKN